MVLAIRLLLWGEFRSETVGELFAEIEPYGYAFASGCNIACVKSISVRR
jgi:hypothetical protein